jgi:hypothetical protein
LPKLRKLRSTQTTAMPVERKKGMFIFGAGLLLQDACPVKK